MMKIAIPIETDFTLYMQNPYTAPQFAIYRIDGTPEYLQYTIDTIIKNPKHTLAKTSFANTQIDCNCLEAEANCFDHICEHYSLLEIISGCEYLLAFKYCQNTSNALKNGGIEVFQIPTIIKQTEIALKNFLIGAKYASKISNIHHGA